MYLLSNWIRIIRSFFSQNYVRADLHRTLLLADPTASLNECLNWLDTIIDWLRMPTMPSGHSETDTRQAARLRYLLQYLSEQPDLQSRVAQTLGKIALESDLTDFVSGAGVQLHYSFTKEFMERFLSLFLPVYRDQKSFKQTFYHLFHNLNDLPWSSDNPQSVLHQFVDLLCIPNTHTENLKSNFNQSLITAIKILSIRAASISLDPELKSRLPDRNPVTSPFFQMQNLVAQYNEGAVNSPDLFSRIEQNVKQCREQIVTVYPLLETSGVSVDLVYKLDTIKILLRRIRLTNEVLRLQNTQKLSPYRTLEFFLAIGIQNVEKTDLMEFLGANINLIARKLVERTSETGEHYIARTQREYWGMFFSATGGGVLTVFTTVMKSLIGKLGAPLFVEGFLAGLNYACSFIFIHLFHFTLATKTPAMTASTLARQLKNLTTPADENNFVEEVICLVRSGFAAVLGNLGLVIPGCIVFDLVYKHLRGQHFFASDYGIEQLIQHNPFSSLTIIYAIVTGFILWLASIIGPWVENWFVYNKYFEILEESAKIKNFLGRFLQKKIAYFLRKNLAGLSTNVALGMLLGFSGIWGTFFGLPLQVRHVTLSTGTLTFGVLSIENTHDHISLILGTVVSIFFIGFFNFGVSFFLSLFVAARARNIRLTAFPHLLVLIARRFLTTPTEFFFPPKKKELQSPTQNSVR